MFIVPMPRTLFFNFIFCLTASSLVCNDLVSPKNTIIVIDLDDVVSINGKVGVSDFWSLPISWGTIFSLGSDFKAISAKGDEIAQTMEGTSNIVQTMLEWLEQEKGYKNLVILRDDIVSRVMKPEPNYGVINQLRELKKRGYTIVGATNQDYLTHTIWRDKMQQHGFDPNTLFDAVLTTRGADPIPGKLTGTVYRHGHNVFEVTDLFVQKPKAEYYQLLKSQIIPQIINNKKTVKHIIFTDDKKANVAGAQAVGIDAIPFPLPKGKDGQPKSARKATLKELAETINAWKQQLQQRGLPIS